MKVSELAKKLKMENEALVSKIKEMGLEVSDASENLKSEEVRILEEKIKKERSSEVVEERIKPTVIRRRAKKKGKPEEEKESTEAAEKSAEAEESQEPETVEEKTKKTAKTPVEAALEPAVDEKKTETKKEAAKKAAAPKEEPPIPEKAAEEKPEPAKAEMAAEEHAEPEEKGRTAPRKRLRTVSREVSPELSGPKIIAKPDKEKKEKPKPKPKAKRTSPEEEKAAAPDKAVGQVVSPEKAVEAGKRKKKKRRPSAVTEESAPKRAPKKREVLIKPEQEFEEGRKVRAPKGAKKQKRTPKQVKKVFQKPTITTPKAIKRVIKIEDVISVGELAKKMGIKSGDVIRKLMDLGTMATINQILDMDTASVIAQEFSHEVENIAFEEERFIKDVVDSEDDLKARPPVVTVMGHVDHGKTTLLDAIREANVVAGEEGGITQHIGAYEVVSEGRKIAFLDTPGHEAFTTMRARGAQVTDIVVLVVAADDGVMPQTREAINHAKAAGVPIIVAVNKIDKPDAKPERVKKQLMEFELLPEDLGGDTIFVEISAKAKTGIQELLEMILIQAEMLELRANPNKLARGIVVEATLDRGRGPIATVLINEGTLKVGDYLVTGLFSGRVRALINDRGEQIEEAGPSTPVEILGLGGVPEAGDPMIVFESERDAREVATHRQLKEREKEMLSTPAKVSLEDLYERIQKQDIRELNLIIKGDVQGSVEALRESLVQLEQEDVKVVIIHDAAGSITEYDVMLASASEAIVIGFNVKPEAKVQDLADQEKVEIKLYTVIYECVEDIKKAITGMMAPKLVEKTLGRAEVREIFNVPKLGAIAGSYVLDGKMLRDAHVRLIRESEVIFEGKMGSLKRFKDDIKEVASGFECGIRIENFSDIQPKDIIEAYEIEEVPAEM
ncbi:MAG: translation initiation factor IF-2 [Deltaproteobacteria bacterium]|nr:translation initiation factor IF-2 [Candidatus Zymogenaceae bacterium]